MVSRLQLFKNNSDIYIFKFTGIKIGTWFWLIRKVQFSFWSLEGIRTSLLTNSENKIKSSRILRIFKSSFATLYTLIILFFKTFSSGLLLISSSFSLLQHFSLSSFKYITFYKLYVLKDCDHHLAANFGCVEKKKFTYESICACFWWKLVTTRAKRVSSILAKKGVFLLTFVLWTKCL